MINKSENINIQDIVNKNPLIYAVQNLDYEKTKILLERGANIHLLDINGEGIFDILQKNTDTEIVNKFTKLIKDYE